LSRSSSAIRLLSELVLAALVLAVVLELTARVYLFGVAGLAPQRIDSVRPLARSGFLKPSPDPEIAYELRPSLDALYKLEPFRTNDEGLRDRDYPLEKPADTVRVAVIGSSFSLPAGVAVDDSFHSRLEQRFSEELPWKVEFINFAVGGYYPSQMLATLRRRALAYDPDVIFFATTEPLLPFLIRHDGGQEVFNGPGPVEHGFFQSFFVQLAEQRLDPPLPSRAAPPAYTFPGLLERWLENGDEPSVLEKLAALSRSRDLPVVLVRLGLSLRPPIAIDLYVPRRAQELGLLYVDTRIAFRKARASDYWIHPLDPHPNAEAHRRFAFVIGDFLKQRGLLHP
jgi:hypothetical protein